MLLNLNDYTCSVFEQDREEGDSGEILFAKPIKGASPSLLIKNHYPFHAANEFLACTLGQQLGVNTARAWLFADAEHAVGIEFLDGLQPTDDKELLFGPAHSAESLRVLFLMTLIGQADGDSFGVFDGKVYGFDFAESFSLGSRDISLIEALTAPPLPEDTPLIDRLNTPEYVRTTYTNTLYNGLQMIARFPQIYGIPPMVVLSEWLRVMEKIKQVDFSPALTDIATVYGQPMADFYSDLLETMKQTISGTSL